MTFFLISILEIVDITKHIFFFTFGIFIACIVLKLSTEYHTKIQLSNLLYWIILIELFQIKLYKNNAFGYVLVSISFLHAISTIIIITKLKKTTKTFILSYTVKYGA